MLVVLFNFSCHLFFIMFDAKGPMYVKDLDLKSCEGGWFTYVLIFSGRNLYLGQLSGDFTLQMLL